MLLSHEHSSRSPLEHARVIDQAKAAELIACTYAVSRLPKRKKKNTTNVHIASLRCHEINPKEKGALIGLRMV